MQVELVISRLRTKGLADGTSRSTPLHSNKRLVLETTAEEFSTRVIDLALGLAESAVLALRR